MAGRPLVSTVTPSFNQGAFIAETIAPVLTQDYPNIESPYFSSSLKIFEHMAAGVPIVATRLPSVKEVLHHGKTAWLVEPGQAKALGDGIASLLRNPDIALGLARQARQEVARYTWARRANSILQMSAGSTTLEEVETGGGEFL